MSEKQSASSPMEDGSGTAHRIVVGGLFEGRREEIAHTELEKSLATQLQAHVATKRGRN